jgi:hypothetical protein
LLIHARAISWAEPDGPARRSMGSRSKFRISASHSANARARMRFRNKCETRWRRRSHYTARRLPPLPIGRVTGWSTALLGRGFDLCSPRARPRTWRCCVPNCTARLLRPAPKRDRCDPGHAARMRPASPIGRTVRIVHSTSLHLGKINALRGGAFLRPAQRERLRRFSPRASATAASARFPRGLRNGI